MLYRLSQNTETRLEGGCISEGNYKNLHYTERCLWEPIYDEERKEWIEVVDEEYCDANGLICLLFYTQFEANRFMEKIKNANSLN